MSQQTATQANAYLRTKVLTANPAQLRLMLLEGAVRFARQARQALTEKDYEAAFNGFSSCRGIVLELINSMRPEVDPALCKRLTSLYTFVYTRLLEASHERDLAKLDEVIGLLDYERETWAMLVDRLASERAAGLEESGPESASAQPGAPSPRRVLSLEG